jgi:hypothetical protein
MYKQRLSDTDIEISWELVMAASRLIGQDSPEFGFSKHGTIRCRYRLPPQTQFFAYYRRSTLITTGSDTIIPAPRIGDCQPRLPRAVPQQVRQELQHIDILLHLSAPTDFVTGFLYHPTDVVQKPECLASC